MPKKSSLPTSAYTVRLTAADKQWLEATSSTTGVSVPTLLVWAIRALQQYAAAHGGVIPTPIDIQTLWKKAKAIAPTAWPAPLSLIADSKDAVLPR